MKEMKVDTLFGKFGWWTMVEGSNENQLIDSNQHLNYAQLYILKISKTKAFRLKESETL